MANKQLIKRLDKVFAEYIRIRDSNGEMFTCCSCGQIKSVEQADAGHFINRRWMSLRWHEQNVHAQCRSCNRFDEGNLSGYMRFMDKKYGSKRVDEMMAMKHESAKWTDEEVNIMIDAYRKKIKAFKTIG